LLRSLVEAGRPQALDIAARPLPAALPPPAAATAGRPGGPVHSSALRRAALWRHAEH